MAITVRLTNKSQITIPEVVEVETDVLLFSRAIYQILGSLTRNRDMATKDPITGDVTIHWEKLPPAYAEFATEMDNLWQHTFYPDLAIAKGVPLPSASIIKADEYLGELGLTEDYMYSKDFVDIPAWLNTTSQTEYRILADRSDNTYLTDSNGTEVLITYT